MKAYPDEFRAKVLATYKVDGQAAAVREHGVAGSTVARWARAAGVETDSATKGATEAACNALETRRARIREKIGERAEELLDRVRSAEGVTPKDVRDLVWSFGVLLDKLRLESGEATERTETITDADRQRVAEDVARTIAEAERIARDAVS